MNPPSDEVYCNQCGDFIGYFYPGKSCPNGCEPRISVRVDVTIRSDLTAQFPTYGFAVVRKNSEIGQASWDGLNKNSIGVLMAWDRMTQLRLSRLRTLSIEKSLWGSRVAR